MASNTTVVNCPSCGAKNPSDSKRCASCGASTEELGPINDEVRNKERRYQQEGFNMTWAAVALAVALAATNLAISDADAMENPSYFNLFIRNT